MPAIVKTKVFFVGIEREDGLVMPSGFAIDHGPFYVSDAVPKSYRDTLSQQSTALGKVLGIYEIEISGEAKKVSN